MDRAVFVQFDAGVEASIGAQNIECCLAVVAFPSLVDFRLGQDNEGGAIVVPLELNFIAFEEILLRDRCGELGDIINTDGGWLAL